jgi:hypothetical protein
MSFCPSVLFDLLDLDLLQQCSPAAQSLKSSFRKKFEGLIGEAQSSAAVQLFVSNNEHCSAWKPRPEDMCDEYMLGTFREEMYRFCTNHLPDIIDNTTIASRGRHGPGSSNGVSGTDFYQKMFVSPLTTTRVGLFTMFVRAYRRLPLWEESFATSDLCQLPMLVEGSKICVVPKNDQIGRTICVEPSLNMFYQLGLGSILEDGLKTAFGIDLSLQPSVNKHMARIGSRTGSFATIDLKSASDSISLDMARWCVPDKLLNWLIFLRSPSTKLPDGRDIELKMLSSMGNGYTFPFQTIIFACVVASVYKLKGYPIKRVALKRVGHDISPDLRSSQSFRIGNFGVFGDDIIVRSDCYRMVCRLLHLLGFTVNADKSFNSGGFRESCGGDYLRGRDIRGIYLKCLSSPQDRLVALNNLIKFSAQHNVRLDNALRYLFKYSGRFCPVPLWENDDAGLRVLSTNVPALLSDLNGTLVYRRWSNRAPALVFGEDYARCGRVRLVFKPAGVYLTLLGGYLRDSRLPIRSKSLSVYTMSKARPGPGWDWAPWFSPRWRERYSNIITFLLTGTVSSG